jgi:ABC-type Fe3+-hydroxamate transport system substrate-binding protein
LDDILISIMDIAKRVGRVTEGRKLVVSLQKRIGDIRMRAHHLRRISSATNRHNNKPKILCVEWISNSSNGRDSRRY